MKLPDWIPTTLPPWVNEWQHDPPWHVILPSLAVLVIIMWLWRNFLSKPTAKTATKGAPMSRFKRMWNALFNRDHEEAAPAPSAVNVYVPPAPIVPSPPVVLSPPALAPVAPAALPVAPVSIPAAGPVSPVPMPGQVSQWPQVLTVKGGVRVMAKAPISPVWEPSSMAKILGTQGTTFVSDPANGDSASPPMPLRSPAGFPIVYSIVDGHVVGTGTVLFGDTGFNSDAEIADYLQRLAQSQTWSAANSDKQPGGDAFNLGGVNYSASAVLAKYDGLPPEQQSALAGDPVVANALETRMGTAAWRPYINGMRAGGMPGSYNYTSGWLQPANGGESIQVGQLY